MKNQNGSFQDIVVALKPTMIAKKLKRKKGKLWD